MATIFSLNDASVCLAVPGSGVQVSERRAVAIDTLDGGTVRDFGAKEGGTRVQLQSDMDDGDLSILAAAVDAGIPLGLSSGAQSHAIVVTRLHAADIPNGRNAVMIDCVVAARI